MDLEEYLSSLKALSGLTRFRILNLLHERKGQGLTQQQISDILDVRKYNISKHIKILYKANLIIEWKTWKYRHCALNPNQKIKSITAVLKEYQENALLKRDLINLKKRIKTKSNK